MRIRVAFWLPRDPGSVSVGRQALDRVFSAFGVRNDCREEIALAVSEACTNAVRHADGTGVYELTAESDDSHCLITVSDDGPGLATDQSEEMPAADAEGGRGLALMRLTTDGVELRPRPNGGMTVRLRKKLRWKDGALGGMPP